MSDIPPPITSRRDADTTLRALEHSAARLMAGANFANATERRLIGRNLWRACDLIRRAERAGRLFGPQEG
jgi:hypothetical protein